jgi:hypothetical protein
MAYRSLGHLSSFFPMPGRSAKADSVGGWKTPRRTLQRCDACWARIKKWSWFREKPASDYHSRASLATCVASGFSRNQPRTRPMVILRASLPKIARQGRLAVELLHRQIPCQIANAAQDQFSLSWINVINRHRLVLRIHDHNLLNAAGEKRRNDLQPLVALRQIPTRCARRLTPQADPARYDNYDRQRCFAHSMCLHSQLP